MRRRAFQLGLVVLASMAVVVIAMVGSATPQQRGADPQRVTSKADPAAGQARRRRFAAKVKDGATGQVPVLVATSGDTAPGARRCSTATRPPRARAARWSSGASASRRCRSWPGQKGVVSVTLIQFKKTGQPLGDPDPRPQPPAVEGEAAATTTAQAATDVPYSKAPPLKGSNFEKLKQLGVLDAKTHNFAEAWKAGYAGEGVDRRACSTAAPTSATPT